MNFDKTTTHLQRVLPAALIVGLLCLAQGCKSSVTVDEWKDSLEQYAMNEANSDTSFLRENSMASPRRGFSIIGTATPEKSTDVEGILLGRQVINGKPWLVFLVGRVKQREVQDIRVAMRSDDGQEPQWLIGDSDADALSAYRNDREQRWRALHPDRKEPPMMALDFPAEGDDFVVGLDQDLVRVTHEGSGAQWSVKIK